MGLRLVTVHFRADSANSHLIVRGIDRLAPAGLVPLMVRSGQAEVLVALRTRVKAATWGMIVSPVCDVVRAITSSQGPLCNDLIQCSKIR